ncbi:MAG: pilus assembly protein TadG-related protein [Hyphomicrobiaceae bacterium]
MRLNTQFIRKFGSDENGAIAVVFGLIAVVFFAFGGVSIDMTRAYHADSRANAALDAAILAAGQSRNRLNSSDAELQDLAARYFNANIANAGVRANEYSNFRLDIGGNGKTFTGSVDVSVPTYFTGLVGFNSFDFTASTSATFDTLDLELGLMLDVTGSMNNRPSAGGLSTKLEILKRAVSQDLLDTLVPANDNDKIRIGYAPYSASVNVGAFAAQVSDPANPPADGCVVERTSNIDGEASPSNTSYFRSIQEANTTLTQDNNSNGTYDYYRCPGAQVLPLTSSKVQLVNTINGYTAAGRTAGHLGIAWAWYLVSPDWASVWGGNSVPKPYGTSDLVKAVILLTDGKFNASYAGSDYRSPAENESYDRANQLCRNIKNKNVVVYAIGFDLDDTRATNALRDCASVNPENNGKLFFPTADEAELRAAFRTIATQLANLRLSR